MLTKVRLTVAAGATLLWVGTVRALPTPAQNCEAGKTAAVGRYARCLETAQRNLVLRGKTTTYATAVGKCEAAQQTAWAKLETRYGGACLTSGDQGGVQTDISDFTTCLNGELGGTPSQCDPTMLQSSLTTCIGNLTTCQTHTCGNNVAEYSEVCDGTDLHSQTCAMQAPTTPYGTLACNAGCTGFITTSCAGRFVDNGDGTVTDNQTNLIWEKKVAISGPHSVGDTFSWSSSGTAHDGTAFTSFLPALNGGATGVGNCVSLDPDTQSGGFAGYCDWRLPTITELQTIYDPSATGCGSGSPCIDPTFGPTSAFYYWSATTRDSDDAWLVNFEFPGGVNYALGYYTKTNSDLSHVRAVRSGL